MRIDLHTHSNVSDGTDAPAQVITDAARTGLDVVALTDHDSTAGWDEAARAAQEQGIALVRGTEISTRSNGISVHLLSYLHDPTDEPLATILEQAHSARDERARTMLDRLANDYPLTWDDVIAQTLPGTVIGRPHLADALVSAGFVPDRSAAFAEILTPDSSYYVAHLAPDTAEVIEAVLAAGGVPVFAHPGADLRGRVVDDATIERLAGAGLAGLEVDHRDHSQEQVERLGALADRLGLLRTGSSDYHGAGKPNRLGENLTAPQALAEIERRGRLDVIRP